MLLYNNSSEVVYCYRSCLFVCNGRPAGGRCLFVCGSVTMITQNCNNLKFCASIFTKLGLYVKVMSNDHLQLIKFWPSCAPGKGSVAGQNFLAPPYYGQRAVFASLQAFFHLKRSCRHGVCYSRLTIVCISFECHRSKI